MARKTHKGLGRGLGALIGDANPLAETGMSAEAASPERNLPIEILHPNPHQPRRRFSDDELSELAASIREHGILQPIIVRPDPERQGEFQIVAGERRWRAAQQARLHEVPVIVRDLDDQKVMEIALVENIQRSDLSPMEEAAAYRALIDRHGYSQEALGKIVGKSRSHIANTMRLLSLPEEVQALVEQGVLGAGHARALVGHPDAVALARRIVAEGLTARDAERLAKRGSQGKDSSRTPRRKREKDADTIALEEDLSAALRRRVRIDHDPATGRGRLVLEYASLEDLDDLCALLTTVSLSAG